MSDPSQTEKAMSIINQAREAIGPDPVGEHGPPAGTPPGQGVPQGVPPAPTPVASPEQQPSAEPPRQTPAGSEVQEGDQRVPYDRFNKVNSERKALADANAKMLTELATLQKQIKDHAAQEEITKLTASLKTPEGEDGKGPSTDALVKLVEKMVELKSTSSQEPSSGAADVAAKWKLMENEGLTLQQAGVVYDFQQKAPNLSLDDVLLLARGKNQELFGEDGSPGDSPPVPGSHSVNTPRSTQSSAPVRNKLEEKREKMLNLPRGAKTSREQRAAALDFLTELTGRR